MTCEHQYDDPELSAAGFLLAIMRDPAVSLHLRMDAAARLLPVYRPPPLTLHIKIVGGLPPGAVIKASTDDGLFAWDLKPLVH
jgi:hypothetical protein